jgi:hypothetical protein
MGAHVLFFGGYKASIPDIKAWTADAMKRKPGVTFDGFPYPAGASSDGEDAVKVFKNSKTNDYAKAIKKIKDSQSDVIFIVGHSSGCAVANEVDDGLDDHKKIILVALDGFAPRNAQLARPSTQVWVAESDTGRSLNHDKMVNRINDYNKKAKDKIQVKVFKASNNCTTLLSLHFSLVNLSSSDALVKDVPDGYKDCQANLPWMP